MKIPELQTRSVHPITKAPMSNEVAAGEDESLSSPSMQVTLHRMVCKHTPPHPTREFHRC